MPDLPVDLFEDDSPLFGEFPIETPRRRPGAPSNDRFQRSDQAAGDQDQVVSIVDKSALSDNLRPSRGRPSVSLPVMPPVSLLAEQALPNLLVAASALVVLLLGAFTPLGLPIWAAGLFVPSIVLALLSSGIGFQTWRRTALVNLATLAMVFPVLVVRQSVIRVPFVDGGNGTMMAPLMATIAVILLLGVLAVACAVLSQEDPEQAGIMFLPAALMVPFLAGQSELVSLSSALKLALGVFVASALLTVVASMLPAIAATMVVPAAIGLEFVYFTIFQRTSIFPTDSGVTARVLFGVVVVATVAFAIGVPILSSWIRQVTRIAETRRPVRVALR